MSTSAIVNRSLRAKVGPVLRAAGFQSVEARNSWRWRERSIWVFNIRAVGKYFSEVTGWPPGAVGIWLGILFRFFPQPQSIRRDSEGRLLPSEFMCQVRSHLECEIDQSRRTSTLSNPAERCRTDLWWVEADGGNADEIAGDVAGVLVEKGLPWFEQHSDPRAALELVERGRPSFNKFAGAMFLARELGDVERSERYGELAEAEARRIGLPEEHERWYVTGVLLC